MGRDWQAPEAPPAGPAAPVVPAATSPDVGGSTAARSPVLASEVRREELRRAIADALPGVNTGLSVREFDLVLGARVLLKLASFNDPAIVVSILEDAADALNIEVPATDGAAG